MRASLHFATLILVASCILAAPAHAQPRAGNPVIPGWYADPEAHVFDGRYWIYPTYSAPYNAADVHGRVLVHGPGHVDEARAHPRHRRASSGRGARCGRRRSSRRTAGTTCSSAPTTSRTTSRLGGIGVARSRNPTGPFEDHLGKPLIDKFHNGAQPIDQYVFRDNDGAYYIVYGGWRHCNIAKLNDDFTGFVPFADGTTFKEITPTGYVEGAYMLLEGRQVLLHVVGGRLDGPELRRRVRHRRRRRSGRSSASARSCSRIRPWRPAPAIIPCCSRPRRRSGTSSTTAVRSARPIAITAS